MIDNDWYIIFMLVKFKHEQWFNSILDEQMRSIVTEGEWYLKYTNENKWYCNKHIFIFFYNFDNIKWDLTRFNEI